MFRRLFWPQGAVHEHYGQYVGWSFVSNFILSVENVLATHSMLSTIGQSQNELMMSVNYIGKDVIGQIGGLAYISKMSEKADKEPIKFAKYSMIFQQSSLLLECTTPFFPTNCFIYTAGAANIAKNISFAGFGAINARVINKLAISDNIGEIYAKISVLNTLGSTLGMGAGLIIISQLPDHYTRLAILPLFTVARIYTFKKSIDNII